LKHFRGELPYIQEKLTTSEKAENLADWLKIEVITETYHPQLGEELNNLLEGKNMEIMLLNQLAPGNDDMLKQQQHQLQSLADLNPVEVFQMKLDAAKI